MTDDDMTIAYAVHNLSDLVLANWDNVPNGRLFLDRGAVRVKSMVNDHPILATLATSNGNNTPLFADRSSVPNRDVLALPDGLDVVATTSEQPLAMSDQIDLFGCLVTLPSGVALCGNFANDSLGKQESGRVAVSLSTGLAEFHHRSSPIACPAWKVVWLNAYREPVFSLTRAMVAALPAAPVSAR